MLLSTRVFKRKRQLSFRLSRTAKVVLIVTVFIMYFLKTTMISFLVSLIVALAAPAQNHKGNITYKGILNWQR